MKIRVWFAVLAAVALFVAAGCGGGSSSSSGGASGSVKPGSDAKPMAKLGAGEGKLNIIAWAGYAEDGSTDPKVDWVTPFEKKTG
ncbi:MAG: extracellular solute-binding protein family 1 [Conexibacter sp.]|nr:extracellular solute-binding protein family 1 [Conexibacter sp.]